MKQISTLLLAAILVAFSSQAQTYDVTSSKNWNGNYPTSCNNCTFNITSGVTLTVDRNVTLQNAKFIGGNIVVNANMNLQTSGSGKTYFTGTKVTVNGANVITASSPVYITNSIFTLYGTSRFHTQNLLELDNSRLNFYGNSNYLATGGPINLKRNSLMVAGDGTLASRAYLYFNGPLLSVYDNSALIIANNNNYYFNWSPYYAADLMKLNFTLSNNKNCGTGYPNSCSMANVYGPVNLMPSGLSVGNALPVVLSDFSVKLNGNNQTELSWTTDMESNSARFEVERSTDGVQWITIATITAKGNSSIASKYNTVDKSPAAGTNYYRLKMVDLDNTFDFSAVKSIKTIAAANMRVYPNPAKDVVNISLPASAASVRLVNMAGQVLQARKSVNGNSTISMDVTSYNAGTYMVQVINTDGTSKNSTLLIAK